MNFDSTITLGNIITFLFFVTGMIGMVIRHRERVQTVEARCVLIETNTKSKTDLLEQKITFLEKYREDDREHMDKLFDDIKEMLNTISEKLDRKADKL